MYFSLSKRSHMMLFFSLLMNKFVLSDLDLDLINFYVFKSGKIWKLFCL